MKSCVSGFLILVLDGGEWSASYSDCFTFRETAPDTHCLEDWVSPRAGLDAVVKRRLFFSSSGKQPPVLQSSASCYACWAIVTPVTLCISAGRYQFSEEKLAAFIFSVEEFNRFFSSALKMEAAGSSNTLTIYQTSWRHITDDFMSAFRNATLQLNNRSSCSPRHHQLEWLNYDPTLLEKHSRWKAAVCSIRQISVFFNITPSFLYT